MTLIKKTIIIASQNTEGYCTVIRVGNDVGAKIVGANFTSNMLCGIKIGSQKTYVDSLNGQKTELSLPLSFTQSDSIGCLIMDNEKVFAKGGVYISKEDIFNEIIEPEEPKTVPIEEIQADITIPPSNDDENDMLKRLGGEDKDFYASAKEKIDELFVIYPPEKKLETLIPDSKWIKISYDGEDYYVVGQLLSDNKLTYIGYGVPGIKAVLPPKITEGYADWLPVDNIKPYDGYWLIFQNADNGKMSNL
ncbi:hypothetical protein EOM82_01715 [bacterium]|nr:hypothetical protein [bacterium]